ncbi:MAG TPA: formimidoylglutamate deiminase, partial [Cryptosporangiaceae bacterium]|nr:formimidoylglutamate deiminase [Cryptosporangiaceae bacterium]
MPSGLASDVLIGAPDGVIAAVETGVAAPADATRLSGVVFPGFANAHSHAFHRALRGRTHTGRGSFWTWREAMYAVAARLDPERYAALAEAAYAEMALAGVTCVGEFHYVHHQPDGTPYADPNAFGEALRVAAHNAGIRLTLLDACYLTGGIGEPLSPAQARFGDRDADAWAARFASLRGDGHTRVGAAIHSVRAVPAAALGTVVKAAQDRPLHVHLSEQPAENAACQAAYGVSPTRLLAEQGALGPHTTAVHATHLNADDIAVLGASGGHVCFCPTTERDLADGIGPARALADAGASLCLGSDQHAVTDLIEEARAMELHERLTSGERGRFGTAGLVDALTWRGHAALGWPEAGRLAVGAPCDLVAVRLDTVRTAGSLPEQVLYAAAAPDVST